ncbi:hypothetical protein ABW21_db0209780 [Orbilia brochopaga]|nr:hypothetical protein ABW21_db0209780 [Drechslerella brochopaga]
MGNMTDRLPLLPDLFKLNKEQWNGTADANWFERDAVGGAPDLIETLANVEFIANHIDDDPNSPTFGWQNSQDYRSAPPAGDNIYNARLMEPISTLSWAYVLDKPWNPYRHHPILLVRLIAALNYWLGLQSDHGGFSELGGPGTEALAPTAFGLMFLVEMMDELDQDGTLDEDVRTRLRTAVYKASELAATDKGFRDYGHTVSNQYSPMFYILWRLWEITNDAKWKDLYNARLDEWIAAAQESPFWLEKASPEAFGYSHVTEWTLDRVFALNEDPRILESMRKYYYWCSLNTVPENDGQTFVTDIVGNGRTSETSAFGEVGYYNHITKYLPNSHAFAITFKMTTDERNSRLSNWIENPIPSSGRYPGKSIAYHIFHNYPMYFQPHGLWTVTPQQQQAAVLQLLPVAQSNFTRYFGPPRAGVASYLFARREGVYVTMHFGQRSSYNQAKEVGIVWLPGFGTLIRGYNSNEEWSFSTSIGDTTTFKRPITDFKIPDSWTSSISEDGSVDAPEELIFSSSFGGIGVQKRYRIDDVGFELSVTTAVAGVEQIPLYIDENDIVRIDGEVHELQVQMTASTITGRSLAVTRAVGGRTTTALVQFNKSVEGTLAYGYPLARGDVYILSVAVRAKSKLVYEVRLA